MRLRTEGIGACGAFFQKALAINHLKSIDFFSFLRVSIKIQSSSLSLFFFTFFIAKKVTKNLPEL